MIGVGKRDFVVVGYVFFVDLGLGVGPHVRKSGYGWWLQISVCGDLWWCNGGATVVIWRSRFVVVSHVFAMMVSRDGQKDHFESILKDKRSK